MEASQSIRSASTRLPQNYRGEELPWGTACLSLFLALAALQRLSAVGPSSTQANVLVTLSLLVCAALAVSAFPGGTLCAFLGLYLALKVLCVSSIVGYSTATYLSLVIATVLARRVGQICKSPIELPGTPWLLWLGVVVFFQFFRSPSLHDAFPVLCDEIVFTLVLWRLPRVPRMDIRAAAKAFIIGTCGAGLAFLLLSPTAVFRLGFDVGFNPNELGNVIGAALLLLTSGFFIRRQGVTFWGLAAILAVLLLRTESRTSIYACFGGIILFLFLRRKRRIAISLALAAVAFVLVSQVKQFDSDPFSLAGRLASPVSESFEDSGAQRAVIWGFLLTQIGNHWKWGAGLRSVPEMTAAAGIGVMETSGNTSIGYQSHNLYLTLLLELGLLGLVLMLGWQFKILIWGISRPFENALLISIMLYLMIQGFFEGSNLNFLSAFLLIAASRVQSEPRPRFEERSDLARLVATSRA